MRARNIISGISERMKPPAREKTAIEVEPIKNSHPLHEMMNQKLTNGFMARAYLDYRDLSDVQPEGISVLN